MKSGIHPTWYPNAVVTCACGNSWTTGSTKKEIHTDVCNQCHPFFTGEQRIVDTAGQVERFMKRINAKEQIAATQPVTEDKKAKKEKRRDRKAGTSVNLQTLDKPAELPLAVVEEKVESEPMAQVPVVEPESVNVVVEQIVVEEITPSGKVEEVVIEVAPVGEPAPVVMVVEEPAAVSEEPAPVAQVQEPETTPVVVVEERAPVAGVEETAPVTSIAKPVDVEPEQVKSDDLETVEGVGPKIASVLQGAGIKTLQQLSETTVDQLQDILQSAGISIADPSTWAEQAQLATEGKLDELKQLQDELVGGRRVDQAQPKAKLAAKKTVAKKPAEKKPAAKTTAKKVTPVKSKTSASKKT